MRVAWLILFMLSGCNGADDSSETTPAPSLALDPSNFTPSGFPRHFYPVKKCDYKIALKAPFEVSEGGWGDADIRVPLAIVDDPAIKYVAEGGPNAQSRVSYAFPSLYRGEGMKEWFASGLRARTAPPPRPLNSAKSTLGSAETLKGDGTRGETRYLGTLGDAREIAVVCSATDWANPVCRGELPIGTKDQRYLIVFPPKAIEKLPQMVEIGDELFANAAARCKPRQ